MYEAAPKKPDVPDQNAPDYWPPTEPWPLPEGVTIASKIHRLKPGEEGLIGSSSCKCGRGLCAFVLSDGRKIREWVSISQLKSLPVPEQEQEKEKEFDLPPILEEFEMPGPAQPLQVDISPLWLSMHDTRISMDKVGMMPATFFDDFSTIDLSNVQEYCKKKGISDAQIRIVTALFTLFFPPAQQLENSEMPSTPVRDQDATTEGIYWTTMADDGKIYRWKIDFSRKITLEKQCIRINADKIQAMCGKQVYDDLHAWREMDFAKLTRTEFPESTVQTQDFHPERHMMIGLFTYLFPVSEM